MKFKFFYFHKLGHFSTNCLLKKSKNKSSGGAAGEALASQFKLDFTLITCMVSSMMGILWNSGAPFHMTSDKELFSDVEEKNLQMHIEMGDDERYSATRLGTVTFERE